MHTGRAALSLSGLPTELLALGGADAETDLRVAESYSFGRNNWEKLPSLNEARSWAASCMLKIKTAYCFCGSVRGESYLNSAEMLEEGAEAWKLIKVKLPRTFHCAAVEIGGNILLFGGTDQSKYCTIRLSEALEILDDQSDDTAIPGWVDWGTVVQKDGKVYAYGSRDSWKNWRLQIFNGFKWKNIFTEMNKL